MKMTPEGAREWSINPDTPDRIIADTLESEGTKDWPLPRYLLDHLEALAKIEAPTEAQVDEARIPLKNYMRQHREELLDIA